MGKLLPIDESTDQCETIPLSLIDKIATETVDQFLDNYARHCTLFTGGNWRANTDGDQESEEERRRLRHLLSNLRPHQIMRFAVKLLETVLVNHEGDVSAIADVEKRLTALELDHGYLTEEIRRKLALLDHRIQMQENRRR